MKLIQKHDLVRPWFEMRGEQAAKAHEMKTKECQKVRKQIEDVQAEIARKQWVSGNPWQKQSTMAAKPPGVDLQRHPLSKLPKEDREILLENDKDFFARRRLEKINEEFQGGA